MITSNYADDIVFARFINYVAKAIVHRKMDLEKKNKPKRIMEIFLEISEWDNLREVTDDYSIDDHLCSYSSNEYYVKKLNIALDKLSKKQRKVIDLYYYCNISNKGIAEYLSITENAVEKLKIRAIKKLREFFDEDIKNEMED